MNRNSIKEELINSGRYEDILTYLRKELDGFIPSSSSPLHVPYRSNEGKTKFRIPNDILIKETTDLIEALMNDEIENRDYSDFLLICHYVYNESEMLAHNFAVSYTHRTKNESNSEETLEKIRMLFIIESMIRFLNFKEDLEYWVIPDGWKKIL